MAPRRLRLMQSRRRWLKQAGVLAFIDCPAAVGSRLRGAIGSPLNTLPRTALVIGNSGATRARSIAQSRQRCQSDRQRTAEARLQGRFAARRGPLANDELDSGVRRRARKNERRRPLLLRRPWRPARRRNDPIPVDAEIDKLEDMRDKTVELNSVLQGLDQSGESDECDRSTRVATIRRQPGVDRAERAVAVRARPGSLLAYATSPAIPPPMAKAKNDCTPKTCCASSRPSRQNRGRVQAREARGAPPF